MIQEIPYANLGGREGTYIPERHVSREAPLARSFV
jgi:hypothetical protein